MPNLPSEDPERPYRRIFEALGDGLILNDVETGLVVEANPAAGSMHGYTHEDFIGLSPATFMHPDSFALFTQWLQTVQIGKSFEATVVHTRRDGTPFTVNLRGTGCNYRDRLCLLSSVRDVSEQVKLLEISQTLASELELQPGLILDQLREILEYTHGVVFTLEGWDLVAQAVSGKQQLDETLPFRVRVGGMETLTALVNERRPQRTADVWGADPVARFLRLLLAEQAAGLLEGVHSWMWVPLATKGRVIGGVGVARVQPNYFTAHHADLALMLANQATIALVNTQQYQQGQVLASLEERRRLAQNLHDAVNQSLFSASLIAEVLPRLWEQHPKEVRESLEDWRRLTRGALAEMRGLLVDLRPLELSESELSELLPLLGDAFSGRTNVPVTVTVGEIGALPGEVQVALYRLCQEALNNVAKHAAATRVAIDLRHEAGIVELRICDDGRGFDTNQIYSGHYGLGMMRERAAAIGATVSITSRSGEGTEITTRWPSAAHGEAP